MLAEAPVTKFILGVTVAFAVLGLVAPALWNDAARLLADDVRSVAAGQWWRIVTAALLHDRGFLLHIGFNMWALAIFGPQIERRSGSLPFALLYLASAAAGGAFFQAFQNTGVAIGASGAIFGLFGVHVASAFLARNTVAGKASLRQLGGLLALNLALPLFVPNIAWQAHVGGLVAGAAILFGWSKVAPLGRVAAGDGKMSATLARSLIAGAVLLACVLALPIL